MNIINNALLERSILRIKHRATWRDYVYISVIMLFLMSSLGIIIGLFSIIDSGGNNQILIVIIPAVLEFIRRVLLLLKPLVIL